MRWMLAVGSWRLFGTAVLAQEPDRISVGPNTRLIRGEYSEPWIAASSSNRNVLIAAAHLAANSINGMNVATAISRDGGRSWVPVQLPGGTSGFDPMVASGPNGRLYLLTGQRSAGYLATYATLSGITPDLQLPGGQAGAPSVDGHR